MKKKNRTKGGRQNSNETHLHIDIPQSAIDAYKSADEKRSKQDEEERRIDKRRLVVEIIGVCFVVVGAVAAIVTLVFIKLSTDAAVTAAEAARTAANAALIANTTAQTSQRAFLSYELVSEENTRHINTQPPYQAVLMLATGWQNSGATPAIDAKGIIAYTEGSAPPTLGAFPRQNRRLAIFAISPHNSATMPVQMPIEKIDTLTPSNRIFIFGWTTYRDTFAGTPIRLTEFCEELVEVGEILQGRPKKPVSDFSDPETKIGMSWRGCGTCYDEMCPDYAERAKAHIEDTRK